MKVLNKSKAIIIYGPPGAGKGTQANLAARHFGYAHFDTGKYLESVVYDPEYRDDPVIKKEKIAFETGKLMTPAWVLKIIKAKTNQIAKAGMGIVFSGSPRTCYEAKRLLPILEKLYGRENIIFFLLDVSPAESIKRNSNRLICSVCGYPILYLKETKHFTVRSKCPFCGGKLFRRSLDKPDIIKKRIAEYNLRTTPVFDEIRNQGYKIITIKSESLPFKVFEKFHLK